MPHKIEINGKQAYAIDDNVAVMNPSSSGWSLWHRKVNCPMMGDGEKGGYRENFKTKREAVAYAEYLIANLDLAVDTIDEFWQKYETDDVVRVLREWE